MKNWLSAMVAVGMILALGVGVASARDFDSGRSLRTAMHQFEDHRERPSDSNGARLETLWIFDADFSTLTGDNAGWMTYDRSGTLGSDNYWHHDTIRINGFTHLGDSTWWCGTYDECWRQSRGYGNEWLQIMERHFDEHVGMGGTSLVLEYDQRYAMESGYDLGHVDLRSPAHGDTWRTVVTVSNPPDPYWPGTSQDWDSTVPTGPGHMVVDITDYIDGEFDLRFRFTSDVWYSSEDHLDNPPMSSLRDGAWQLDNITIYVDTTVVFYDDAESGDPWSHEGWVTSGQTGVTFWRGQYGIDFVTGRGFMCVDRPVGTWMYAPVDPFTSAMVDDEWAWLVSPPIDISAAPRLVGQWDCWIDAPRGTGDRFNLLLSSDDSYNCVTRFASFADEQPGYWYQSDPKWWGEVDSWDHFAGRDWLAVCWEVFNYPPWASGDPHWGGLFLNRQRVGIPPGDPRTSWEFNIFRRFHDWFQDELSEALLDTAAVKVTDEDSIATVFVVASNDDGQSWESYQCTREDPGDPEDHWWLTPPPATQMTPGSEIRYYFEATDGVGNVSTSPEGAPDETFEMSILPITASVSDPGLLLVDSHGHETPGAQRDWRHMSEYYYREALEILGYEYDVFDEKVPHGSGSHGPDTTGMKYYDTQIWFTNELESYLIRPRDQRCLIAWLNQSAEGKERNLLLAGNNIGYELIEAETETLAFYETWLATHYIENAVGQVVVDSVPGLEDHAGDWDFMTHDDGEAILRGGCPVLHYFDVIEPFGGIVGTETVADYIKQEGTRRPAGVAYTNQVSGYQTVNLGFGIELMMDGTYDGSAGNYTPEGYYHTGLIDRVNLLQNIMAYFGKSPTGEGTGVVDGHRNELSHAYPNPFNPVTTIAYAVKDAGPVTIEVYNVAGRLVRTLLDGEVDAGASGFVVWDGTDGGGERCASGVYFYRIAAPGFTESRKMIMLR